MSCWLGAILFLRECIKNGLQATFGATPIEAYDSFDFLPPTQERSIAVVIVAAHCYSRSEVVEAVRRAAGVAPLAPAVLFSLDLEVETARVAIAEGAKAYIPMTMGFKVAVEAVRFILAGGAYVPPECLLAPPMLADVEPPPQLTALPRLHLTPPVRGAITARELAVVRAIQQGKQNKVIAYEIGCSETTVKVHLRNVMRKLGVRNRTEVAIRASEMLVEALAATATAVSAATTATAVTAAA